MGFHNRKAFVLFSLSRRRFVYFAKIVSLILWQCLLYRLSQGKSEVLKLFFEFLLSITILNYLIREYDFGLLWLSQATI